MTTPKLSALVVAHNEEAQLADCLETLRFADEIVVVLDRCTDRSREIAARYTDRLLEGAWPVEGARRNEGIAFCSGDWILEIDADERVTPALAAEIRTALANARPGYFIIPFHNYVGDHLVRHGWGAYWGVSAKAALFSKGMKHWGSQRVHPAIEMRGEKQMLTQPILHYVDRNISDMIQRLDRYTTARAADLRESGDIGSLGANLRRVFSRFYKCYIRRKGYREGQYGLLIALMAGLYPILSYLKANLEKDS
ncbi:glycosyltransferase family 2 protein [uncultured Ferrovibrio sp.]|jgi:glycosyltransferase involved in cell wall biosynthesis|uniref:glycosyltransferase family 2 protein n=1 Tax=uncultured Ferrovibrio sp. TaxID=1576913 RepID=UPI00261FEC87|nr:glycosyltransferase family 2 protein [uncultured Ferrovibrio sp.]